MIFSASRKVAVGGSVIGSTIMPDCERLTLSTSAAWASGEHVAVDDADAALARQRNRQARLGHRVHGSRDDGNIQADIGGQLRADVRLVWQHLGVARERSAHRRR